MRRSEALLPKEPNPPVVCRSEEPMNAEVEHQVRLAGTNGSAARSSASEAGMDERALAFGREVPGHLPGWREVAARCALPLAMGLMILGTVLWGGFITFVLALLLWKAAGVVL